MKKLIIVITFLLTTPAYALDTTSAVVGYMAGKGGNGDVNYPTNAVMGAIPVTCWLRDSYCQGERGKDDVLVTEKCTELGSNYKVIGFVPRPPKGLYTILLCS